MLLTEYDREMDIAVNRREAKEEGLEEGMEKGMEQEKLVIAKNLLAKGSSAEFVHEITGLPLETIKEI
jgi:predicted transposase/invertase (TIGR01784 family)